MKTKFLIIPVLIILLIVLINLLNSNDESNGTSEANQTVTGDPMDTASHFYNDWLDALQSTSTDPYEIGLASDARLVTSVQEYITARQVETEDPVLCLLNAPPRVGAKPIYQVDNTAQLMMLARGLDEATPKYALVDLEGIDGEWKITKIECVNSEAGPDREFTFEKQGFLLKSGESGLDPNIWYLVFKENGVDGHTVPLYFSEASLCTSSDGSEQVCAPDQFTNPSEAIVKGEMTESGVEVNIVEFVN